MQDSTWFIKKVLKKEKKKEKPYLSVYTHVSIASKTYTTDLVYALKTQNQTDKEVLENVSHTIQNLNFR